MMKLASLIAESGASSIVVRAIFLATVLLACAWVLARKAGPHNAALRSHIWTTAVMLLLLIPLFSLVCECQEWTLVDLSTDWLRSSGDVHHEPAGIIRVWMTRAYDRQGGQQDGSEEYRCTRTRTWYRT